MKLFTIPELANQIGKSRQWIWQLVILGKLKAKRVGGIYIIKESDIPSQLLPTQPNNSNSKGGKNE